MKSFVFKSNRAFDPAKLEDFLGAIVNIYGPRMLRYKGVLFMKGTERKVIFQGVHQLMGSDLGPAWAADEVRGMNARVHRRWATLHAGARFSRKSAGIVSGMFSKKADHGRW